VPLGKEEGLYDFVGTLHITFISLQKASFKTVTAKVMNLPSSVQRNPLNRFLLLQAPKKISTSDIIAPLVQEIEELQCSKRGYGGGLFNISADSKEGYHFTSTLDPVADVFCRCCSCKNAGDLFFNIQQYRRYKVLSLSSLTSLYIDSSHRLFTKRGTQHQQSLIEANQATEKEFGVRLETNPLINSRTLVGDVHRICTYDFFHAVSDSSGHIPRAIAGLEAVLNERVKSTIVYYPGLTSFSLFSFLPFFPFFSEGYRVIESHLCELFVAKWWESKKDSCYPPSFS
jgi:hypothetical protein